MGTLYLTEQNTILRKTGQRMLLCHKRPGASTKPGVRQGDIIIDLPCEDVDHVMIFGNIQLTTQVMHQLLKHGIETALFSTHGKLIGQITPITGKNIELRLAQYEKFKDDEFGLKISKSLIEHKIKNELEFVHNYSKNHPDIDFETEQNSIQKIITNLQQAENIESLLGYEGSASAQYFKCLGKMLSGKWGFTGRNKRPPKDPVNAVLSFGYTLVTSELQALLDGIGFDPYLGFYHQPRYGTPCLALDLVEIFRHPMIDRLMLRLFNLSILNENDFMNIAKGGVYLNKSGKIKFIKQYEKLMGAYTSETEIVHTKSTFRSLMQKQIYAIKHTIQENRPLELFPVNIDE